MSLVTSASYAITVRLDLPADGLPASQLTQSVESVGRMVTAFDVTSPSAWSTSRSIESASCCRVPVRRGMPALTCCSRPGRLMSSSVTSRASCHCAVVATGRSDYPNQINNVLAFPGVCRGLLDAQCRSVPQEALLAAATALADVVSADERQANYIVPSMFHPGLSSTVAAAVKHAVERYQPGD